MDNTWILLAIAIVNLATATVVIWQARIIKLLELNTNSIKDALVASTAKASRGEGVVAGRAEERADAKGRDIDKRRR